MQVLVPACTDVVGSAVSLHHVMPSCSIFAVAEMGCALQSADRLPTGIACLGARIRYFQFAFYRHKAFCIRPFNKGALLSHRHLSSVTQIAVHVTDDVGYLYVVVGN